ncbi:hypothetical protein N9L18_00600 [Candidatus Pacebacteria bacterium]|nr:hypothetical protein [Candidatus Paceibacterota bacterium]
MTRMVMNIHQQKEKVESEIKKLESMGHSFSGRLRSARDSAFTKFPLIFVLLSSFGLVATFYGFEKVIDQIPYFIENPQAILITGIGTLILTGALYKKLS